VPCSGRWEAQVISGPLCTHVRTFECLRTCEHGPGLDCQAGAGPVAVGRWRGGATSAGPLEWAARP